MIVKHYAKREVAYLLFTKALKMIVKSKGIKIAELN